MLRVLVYIINIALAYQSVSSTESVVTTLVWSWVRTSRRQGNFFLCAKVTVAIFLPLPIYGKSAIFYPIPNRENQPIVWHKTVSHNLEKIWDK